MYRFLLLIVLMLTACGPSAESIATAAVQTVEAAFTATLTVTPSPGPTPTFTSTYTPTPTETPTPLPPRMQTAAAFDATRTASALKVTQTATYRQSVQTATAHAVGTARKGTATAVAALATRKASYFLIDGREIRDSANAHLGELVRLPSMVDQVINGTDIRIVWLGNYDFDFYVELAKPTYELARFDNIVVFGRVSGTECYTNMLGGTHCEPRISEAWYEKR